MPTKIIVDGQSYIFVDGVKVAQLLPGNILSFHDKNRHRSSRRGANTVQISIEELQKEIVRHNNGTSDE